MNANCCEQCAEFDKNPGHDGKDGDCLSAWNLTEIKIPGREPERQFARVCYRNICKHFLLLTEEFLKAG